MIWLTYTMNIDTTHRINKYHLFFKSITLKTTSPWKVRNNNVTRILDFKLHGKTGKSLRIYGIIKLNLPYLYHLLFHNCQSNSWKSVNQALHWPLACVWGPLRHHWCFSTISEKVRKWMNYFKHVPYIHLNAF